MKTSFFTGLLILSFVGCNNHTKTAANNSALNTDLKNRISVREYITGDVNNDNIIDTVRFAKVPYPDNVPYDFTVTITYSFNGGFRKKRTSSVKHASCLFYGLNIVNSLINIRYSDEQLNDHIYKIFYDPKDDKFFLIRYFLILHKEHMQFTYNLFDNERRILEVPAIRFCRAEYNYDTVLEDTLTFPEGNSDCILIPEEKKGEAEYEIATPLWTDNKND